MNGYTLFILGALLSEYLLVLAADLLHLKGVKQELPAEFVGIYNPEAYGKSQRYAGVWTAWTILKSTVTLLALIIFWFLEGFGQVDRAVRALGCGSLLTGLIYLSVFAVLTGLLNLPFSIVETFYIEEKFGFNRTRPVTFVLDLLKGWSIAVLLGIPLVAAILFLFQRLGPAAWWTGWLTVSVFVFFVQWIGPTWILPLFNRFTPLEPGELKDSILAYGNKVQFPIENIYVMDGSKRSSKGNAFFTGFGRRKKIALFDTLIERQSVPELVAVLAHEIGHYKKGHVLISMALTILNLGALFYLFSLFAESPVLSRAFFLDTPSLYASLLFFSILFSPLEFILSLFLLAISRRNELAADRFAAESLPDPEAMVRALKKLAVENLASLTPHPFHVILNDSHPPLPVRIEAIRQLRRP